MFGDPKLVLTALTLVLVALGLVPQWVPFLEERPQLVGWLAAPLRFVGRWWPVLLGVGILVLVAYVVWVWGSRWYESVLWRAVVRPAVSRFGVEAARGADSLRPGYADLLREVLRALDFDSLWVLEGALARRRPGCGESVLEYPDGMRLNPPGSGAVQERPRFEGALTKLQAVGAIAGWEAVTGQTGRNFSIKVVLPTRDWRALERLRVAAEVELAHRSTMEVLRAIESASAPARSEDLPGEEGEWSKEVDELGVVPAWVLNRILYWYDRFGEREVVAEDAGLRTLAAELGAGIEAVREACRLLREAGFLSSVQWKVEGEKCRLSVEVGPKVAGVAAVPGLRKAIDRRMKRDGAWR